MNKLLGVDFGTKNIGLALGSNGLAVPLTVLSYRPNHAMEKDVVNRISQIISEEKVKIVVFGRNIKHKTAITDLMDSFIEKLKQTFILNNNLSDIKIDFIDEFKSSDESVKEMIQKGVSQKNRSNDHSYAAAKILVDYMRLSQI